MIESILDQDQREEQENAAMKEYISDQIGLSEAIIEGFSDEQYSELREALADCIDLRNAGKDATDLCHKILGRLIAENAIKFLKGRS